MPEGGGRPGLNLRFSSLVAACVLLLAAVALAYLAGVMRGRAAREGGAGPEKPAATAPAPKNAPPVSDYNKILAPEELRFSQVLKDRPANATQAKTFEAVKPGQEKGKQAGQPGKPAPGGAEQRAAETVALYDYVFQVAAFKDEENADVLRQRLEGRGLRTRMQRDGKSLAVLVLLRGTEQRAAEVAGIMEELRLGKPMLRAKKTVTP